MDKIKFGVSLGIIAGIIDISPMLTMKLPCSAVLSAFLLWIIVGFFIATSTLKINSILKGILISYLTLLPTAILIGQNNIADLIPIIVMTSILGSSLGFLIER